MAVKSSPPGSKSLADWFQLLIASGLVIFLVGITFHLVIKKLIPGPIGTYWKEGLLALLLVFWGVVSILKRKPLFSDTTLDIALGAFLGYVILRLVINLFTVQAWWGFYYTIMYLPVFWLVVVALRKYPTWLERLVWLVIILGAIVSIGGILEFIVNRSLWPSSEIIQRQGFPDVYIYGSQLRRVYFVFDSPTTLANTLALIFPLSLGMVYAASSIKTKVLAGLAALVMLACIGFTFSRGIWVASAVGLIVMGLLSGIFQRNKYLTLSLAGIAVIGVFAWIGITTLRAVKLPASSSDAKELTSADYRKVPIQGIDFDLMVQKPLYGETTLQSWTIFDPIQQQNDPRVVLYEPALQTSKNEIGYRVTVPESAALKLAIALSPQVWSANKGDGVDFQVYIAPVADTGNGQFLLNRYINPKINPSDRRWRNYLLDLTRWAGQEIDISLIVDSGPSQNWNYDWAGWADVSVVSLPQGYFTAKNVSGDRLVVQYFRSISDWVHDETNLDRLAAWNLSLDAWRRSPLWGTGLGSTGLAGFRSEAQTTFVTESQILKVLTELGIPGIIVFAFLWITIARVGVKAMRQPLNPKNKAILLGILTSLVIIFIEGWVYQNMEAKQVNALFWTLTGMLAYISVNKNV